MFNNNTDQMQTGWYNHKSSLTEGNFACWGCLVVSKYTSRGRNTETWMLAMDGNGREYLGAKSQLLWSLVRPAWKHEIFVIGIETITSIGPEVENCNDWYKHWWNCTEWIIQKVEPYTSHLFTAFPWLDGSYVAFRLLMIQCGPKILGSTWHLQVEWKRDFAEHEIIGVP